MNGRPRYVAFNRMAWEMRLHCVNIMGEEAKITDAHREESALNSSVLLSSMKAIMNGWPRYVVQDYIKSIACFMSG